MDCYMCNKHTSRLFFLVWMQVLYMSGETSSCEPAKFAGEENGERKVFFRLKVVLSRKNIVQMARAILHVTIAMQLVSR